MIKFDSTSEESVISMTKKNRLFLDKNFGYSANAWVPLYIRVILDIFLYFKMITYTQNKRRKFPCV